jgi:hypothetical protein
VPGLVKDASGDGDAVVACSRWPNSAPDYARHRRRLDTFVPSTVTPTTESGFTTRGNNVTLDVCVYNRATQTTRIATVTNTILLPDALEEAYVNRGWSHGYCSAMMHFLGQAVAARVDFQATR